MIQVDVTDQGVVEKAAKLLAGIDGGIDKALRSASSRSTSHLRSQSTKAIRERYAISAANVKANQNISVKYSYGSGVQATISFRGNKIPLFKYSGASPSSPSYDKSRTIPIQGANGWRMMHPGKPAKGHQLKGSSPANFKNAFVARMASGHIGIFERTGGQTSNDRAEVKEIMGSSVPQMLGSEEVEQSLAESTMAKFEERLDHEVLALLNGWR